MTDRLDHELGTSLSEQLVSAPMTMRPDLAEARVAEWLRTLDPRSRVHAIAVEPLPRALLLAIADHSPFLWRLVVMDPARCARLFIEDPEVSLAGCLERIETGISQAAITSDGVMQILRRAKQEIALLVAFADLGGLWDVDRVTRALTRFADCAVDCAFAFLLREAHQAGKLLSWQEGCGLAVLALGKQGGRELNYSSDIDLVVFFDPQTPALAKTTVPSPFYVRLTQNFVRLMQERTADGYVLRVDLRLRPDPASTAVAISLPSAFSYYERLGQNWERAAFIKARPIAGDLALGRRFLADLAPFIWRKYFDYAALADIHAMKRQIHAVRGHADVAVAGHDIKLGRGGIREIEFFVQTQQLIFGGRRPKLRGPGTLNMLAALHGDGWIGASAVSDLTAAYRFLREIEHRLQMIADEQTQRLPTDGAALEAFARFAGFLNLTAFSDTLVRHLRCVEGHYAQLFEHAPGLDTAAGSLVFTGTTDDPATLETLRAMGFSQPAHAAETIRGWHFGRRSAVQSPRAREVLTELLPSLLDAFSGSADPDAALATMDTMLGRMSAGIELLSLLRSNAVLRNLFADILGSAPRLAATISARPHVLDAAIDPATLRGAGEDDAVAARVSAVLRMAGTIEDILDRARDLTQEELFLIGVRLLSGADDPSRSGEAHARLAELIVREALRRCLSDFAIDHGTMPGGACVVLGMGKLGSHEMTGTSDLDLIVIYRFDPDGGESDGRRPLDGARYYTRLMQRLLAALTAPTRRGRLYDVDLRLRPSGKQGPLATQFRSFVDYQANEAQTWEYMALTRARVVAGDDDLARDVGDAIRATLLRPRDSGALRNDIRSMRALVAREKGETTFWDMKLVAGGLLDIEFMAQFLALRFASIHPSLLLRAPAAILAEAERLRLLPQDDAGLLLHAYQLQTAITQLARLIVDGPFDPAKAGQGVIRRLCAAANQPNQSALESELLQTRVRVRALFVTLLRPDGQIQ